MKQSLKLMLLVVSISFLPSLSTGQTNIYVATNGNDSNSGSISSPLKTLLGARNKVRTLISSGVPSGGVVVNFRGGRYPITAAVGFSASTDSGTSGRPIVYQGYQNEDVIFDGTKFVSNSAFQLETNNSILHASAAGKVYVQTITDTSIINVLKNSETAQMAMDDQMMILSRFPNLGFTTMNTSNINNSTEEDRVMGTQSNPKGARFNLTTSFNASKWNAELNNNTTGDVYVRGYMSADWFKGTLTVNSVSTNGQIHLREGSRYGIENRGGEGPNRLYVGHLLCELDEPGEWYFNQTTNKLYIYPYSTIDSNSKIGVWAGPQLAVINSGSHIQFKNMTIQGIGAGSNGDAALNFKAGSNFLVAGVTFRYIATPVLALNFLQQVTNSSAISCDFFDIPNSVRLYGGSFNSTGNVVNGNNRVENCHFTQIFSKDFNGKAVGIIGVRNIFKNNLVHNENIQPITYAGIDHIIERNEIFNVGIEEGDGGAIYTGGDIMSYGNVVKHNFIHHIMCIPTLLGRASIFSDDLDGGDQMRENVTYKGGWEVLKMNTGAGHTVQHNVLLDGFKGIRQSKGGTTVYNSSMEYINSTNGRVPSSGDKNNYMGRMLQKIGTPNWENGLNETNWYNRIEPFWKSRYPTFDFVMKAYSDNNQMNGYECRYYDNMFWSNNQNVELAGDTDASVQRSQAINLSIFDNPDNLDFRFKTPRPSYTTNIPFDNIGLYTDSYRCALPDKDAYRRLVKQRFEEYPSYTTGGYNSATINDRLYYNTGKMIYASVACNDTFAEDTFFFDFGTPTSPRFSGYDRVSQKTVIGNGLYGWTNVSGVNSVDRGLNNSNAINSDLVYSSQTRTFEVRVPNGNYNVTVTLGDKSASHDNMRIKAEGVIKVSSVSRATNQIANESFTTSVSDGKLSLEFSDIGGTDANWVVNRVIITPSNTAPPAAQTEFKLDLGSTSSPLASGYERLTPSTTTGLFRWTNTSGINSVDRGAGSGANSLNRDLIYSSQTRTLEVDIPNGSYDVLVTLGDPSAPHDNMRIKAEGVIKVNSVSRAANQLANESFNTTVNDGKLELEFSDLGGTDVNWVATRIMITPGTAPPADTTGNTNFKVDFGTTTSPVFSGYVRGTNASTRTGSSLFGWTNTASIGAVDRGTLGGHNNLNRDLVYSNQPRTLELDVPDGNYQVIVTLGDACCQHDNMVIKAEGVVKKSNVDRAANQMANEVFTTTVSDGILSLEFSDAGGTDANWVVNRVIVSPVGSKSIKDIKEELEEEEVSEEFRFYPNPVSDILNIEIPSSVELGNNARVVIYGVLGNIVLSEAISDHNSQVSLDRLSSGIYNAVVITADKSVRTRLVKK